MTCGGGFRDLGHGLVLSGADAVLETSLGAIEQAVEHFDLLGREGLVTVGLPEARFDQQPIDSSQGLLQALEQRCEEPLQPWGDVQRAFLARFQDAVVAGAVIEDARRHGVEADGLLFALGQCQISDCASEATVAVIERVQGYEPEVRNAGA